MIKDGAVERPDDPERCVPSPETLAQDYTVDEVGGSQITLNPSEGLPDFLRASVISIPEAEAYKRQMWNDD